MASSLLGLMVSKMQMGRTLLVMFVAALCLKANAANLKTALWVDGNVDGAAESTKTSKIEFEFRDAETGEMAHHFHSMHAKPMHLIVVSEDLSHFAHVHPNEKPHSVKPFYINANSPTNDPDNFAVPKMLPFGGKYFLFAEVMPMGYGMLNFPYDLNVNGPTRSVEAPVIDAPGADGKILKYFNSHGEPSDESGGTYLIKLEVLPMEHCQVVIPRLHFEVLQKQNGIFTQVKDLEPWLESYGHAIMIGREGKLASEKAILHLHAVWPLPTGDVAKDERGPNLELATHSHGQSMQSDHYRAWIQIKHSGKVHTFNFEIEWKLEEAVTKASRSTQLCLN